MNRRGFLQSLLAAFGAAVVEPVARGTTVVEWTAEPEDLEPLEPEPAPAPAEIDLDLLLRGSLTVAYLRLRAGQRVRLHLRTPEGGAYVHGATAYVGLDRVIVESISNDRINMSACSFDLSLLSTDCAFCPFDFGMALEKSGPTITLVVPERCGDQEFAIAFAAQMMRDDQMRFAMQHMPHLPSFEWRSLV